MSGTALPPWLSIDGADCIVRVKAVPGASRSQVVGALGDRLKVRVAAPPEAGKANAAIAELLAQACGVAPRAVTLEQGASQAQKCFRVRGADAARVAALGS